MVAHIVLERVVVGIPEEAVEERLGALAQPVRIVLGPAESDGVVPVSDIADAAVFDQARAQIPAVVEDVERAGSVAAVRAKLEDAAAIMQVGAERGILLL